MAADNNRLKYDLKRRILRLYQQGKISSRTTLLLVDIDGALKIKHEGGMDLNMPVVNSLKRLLGDPNVLPILFSNMNVGELKKLAQYERGDEEYTEKPYLRMQILEDLEHLGIPALGVTTNADLGYEGAGSLFNRCYLPMYDLYQEITKPKPRSSFFKKAASYWTTDGRETKTVEEYIIEIDKRNRAVDTYMRQGREALKTDPDFSAVFAPIAEGGIFSSEQDQHQGLGKMTTLKALLDFFEKNGIPLPAKIMLVDDNLGALQAIRFQVQLKYPKIMLEAIHWRGAFNLDNAVVRHLFAANRLFTQVKQCQVAQKYEAQPPLLLACRRGEPQAFFKLARFTLNGDDLAIPYDRVSAFYLAQVAILLFEKEAEWCEVQGFIDKYFSRQEQAAFMRADRKIYCNEKFPILFDGFNAYDLYVSVKMVSPRTQWQAIQNYNVFGMLLPAEVNKAIHQLTELFHDRFTIISYLRAMQLYMQCGNEIGRKCVARFIEDYHRPLILQDALLDPVNRNGYGACVEEEKKKICSEYGTQRYAIQIVTEFPPRLTEQMVYIDYTAGAYHLAKTEGRKRVIAKGALADDILISLAGSALGLLQDEVLRKNILHFLASKGVVEVIDYEDELNGFNIAIEPLRQNETKREEQPTGQERPLSEKDKQPSSRVAVYSGQTFLNPPSSGRSSSHSFSRTRLGYYTS